MTTSDFELALAQNYRAARHQWAGSGPLVLLHIGEQQTGVAVGADDPPPTCLALDIGSDRTAAEYFKHPSPNPLELENAIVTVEDEVSRVHKLIPAGARLLSLDPVIKQIAQLSGVRPASGGMILSIEAMERSFERLTQVALGQAASSSGLPADKRFAATLLILREFMHHLQFEDITVLSADPQVARTSS